MIDALEEPGGALTAIYPEKYIYDVIGSRRWRKTLSRIATSRHGRQSRQSV